MYNVLEKLRSGEPLSAKEKTIHEKGLVSVLKKIHDDLDAAVFDAYGWPHDLTDEQILEHLRLQLAKRKDPRPPVVHSIGYSIDDPGAEFLKAISKEYKGQYRRISKI